MSEDISKGQPEQLVITDTQGVASQETPAVADAAQEPASSPAASHQKEIHIPKERLDREILKRKKQEEEALQAKLEVARLKGILEASQKPQETQHEVPLDERPKSDNFQTYEEFTEALADWKARKTYESFRQKEIEQQTTASKQHEEIQSYQRYKSELNDKSREALQKYPDFYDKMTSPDVAFPDAVAKALLQTKAYADIAYHLGNNPEKSVQLAQLMQVNPVAAAMEIGRLEAAFTYKPAAVASKVSSAPEPAKPLTPASMNTMNREETAEEYIIRRNREDAERRNSVKRR